MGNHYLPDQLLAEPGAGQPPATQNGSSQTPQTTQPTAADFEVVDGDGNPVKLSDFFGKPVVLNFWASWCGPCRKEMPDFDRAYQKYGNEVVFLLVNMTGGRETVEKAKAFVRDQGFHFPIYFDTEENAAAAYGVNSLPTTYFLNADGTIAARGRGMLDMETLERGISMILPPK